VAAASADAAAARRELSRGAPGAGANPHLLSSPLLARGGGRGDLLAFGLRALEAGHHPELEAAAQQVAPGNHEGLGHHSHRGLPRGAGLGGAVVREVKGDGLGDLVGRAAGGDLDAAHVDAAEGGRAAAVVG
jgi:hypothetical protein